MSQRFFYILAALYICWFLGSFGYLLYVFTTASSSPDSLHMTPFPDLWSHQTVYLSFQERWQVFALIAITGVTAIGAQWARLVWYCKYREAGGKPEGRMVEI